MTTETIQHENGSPGAATLGSPKRENLDDIMNSATAFEHEDTKPMMSAYMHSSRKLKASAADNYRGSLRLFESRPKLTEYESQAALLSARERKLPNPSFLGHQAVFKRRMQTLRLDQEDFRQQLPSPPKYLSPHGNAFIKEFYEGSTNLPLSASQQLKMLLFENKRRAQEFQTQQLDGVKGQGQVPNTYGSAKDHDKRVNSKRC